MQKKCIYYFSTPLHSEDIDFLVSITPIIKISSGDLTHLELIKYAAKKTKQLIISTGLGNKKEIQKAIHTVHSVNPEIIESQNLILMHCISAYPTPVEDANLNNILWLKEEFNLPVGYSDHTKGIKACELSVPLGVKIIEKHFTYSRKNQTFHDHAISAEPKEMKLLVKNVKSASKFLGKKERNITKNEIKNFENMRRSFCVSRDLKKGVILKKDDLILLRPALGFGPLQIKYLLGKTILKDLKKGEIIGHKDIK